MKDKDNIKTFYFTFDPKHPLKDMVQCVYAPDESTARKSMADFYGDFWSHCYNSWEVAVFHVAKEKFVVLQGLNYKVLDHSIYEGVTIYD